MKNKRFNLSIALIIVMVLGISITSYAASVISVGDLTAGAVICNSDGSVTNSIPFSETRNIPRTTSSADYTYVFLLSGSATYKAFLKPENGLHLYMNRATIWYD